MGVGFSWALQNPLYASNRYKEDGMRKIFVVGSINTDLVINAPYIPQKGETLTGGGFFTARGGKGANQAVAAARLGGQVYMCGCVGDDAFGQEAVASLKEAGVDTSFVRAVEKTPTGTAVIIVVDGDNQIILDKGANERLRKEDIDKALESALSGDIYLTQLENPIAVVGYGLQKAKEKGMFVVLNPAPANKEILPFLPYCDLVIPNETEMEILGQKAIKTNDTTVIETLGEQGYRVYSKSGEKDYPCIKVKAVDTTAAGDTFCGGLCAKLSQGVALEESAAFGSKAASIACTRKGAQPSIPTKEEVESYCE